LRATDECLAIASRSDTRLGGLCSGMKAPRSGKPAAAVFKFRFLITPSPQTTNTMVAARPQEASRPSGMDHQPLLYRSVSPKTTRRSRSSGIPSSGSIAAVLGRLLIFDSDRPSLGDSGFFPGDHAFAAQAAPPFSRRIRRYGVESGAARSSPSAKRFSAGACLSQAHPEGDGPLRSP